MQAENIFGIAKLIAVLPAIFWLIGQFAMPRRYWQGPGLPLNRLSTFAKWKEYGGAAILFVGLILIAYDATDAVMDWMPRSWGGFDEEGEWQAVRPGIQGMMALFIAGSVIDIAEKRAEAAAKWPIDHALVLRLIEVVERPSHTFGGEDEPVEAYRLHLIQSGRGALKNERYDDAFALKRYREQLINWLTDVETRIEGTQK